MAGAFEDLRVLDLSWGMAGPMTTMFLADNGADVIRIEPPDGDPFAQQTGYRVWNRGKRSAVLDVRQTAGREALLALAQGADVVLDSFRPGVMERLGLGHATLSARNPIPRLWPPPNFAISPATAVSNTTAPMSPRKPAISSPISVSPPVTNTKSRTLS